MRTTKTSFYNHHSIPRLDPAMFSPPEKKNGTKRKRVSSTSPVKNIMTKIIYNKLSLVFNREKSDKI